MVKWVGHVGGGNFHMGYLIAPAIPAGWLIQELVESAFEPIAGEPRLRHETGIRRFTFDRSTSGESNMSLHRHHVFAAAIALAALTSSFAWSAVFSAHHSRHNNACPTAVESNLKKGQSSGHPDLMKQCKKGNVGLDDPHYVPAKGAIEQDNAQ